jgi:hypothetical protein
MLLIVIVPIGDSKQEIASGWLTPRGADADKDFGGGLVFWWFERKGQFLRYEAREAPDGGYELCVVRPDGAEQVEHFANSAELSKRQLEFEHQIVGEGWTGPHGWNL